jgi:hypothetical protein
MKVARVVPIMLGVLALISWMLRPAEAAPPGDTETEA